MANLEDLLSSIKAEQTTSPPTTESSPAVTPKPSPLGETRSVEDLLGQLDGHPPDSNLPPGSSPGAAALNALLADLPPKIGSAPSSSHPPLTQSSPPISSLAQPLEQVLAPSLAQTLATPSPRPLDLGNLSSSVTRPEVKLPEIRQSEPISPALGATPLPLLEDLKAQYAEEERQRQAQARAEQERLRQEQEAALARQRQEQERQAKEKQARIEKAAQAWLKQLDPLCGEAIWFDEFASHYPSRLAAAIDYLNLDD